jgi:hypothetical protein
MRSLRPLLVLHLLAFAPSAAPAQGPVRAPEAPTGTNWIADREIKHYFPVDCEAVISIPRPDRLYYASESAVRKDGYIPSPKCPTAESPRLADAGPRLADAPAPASRPTQTFAPVPATNARENQHARRGFWFSGGLGYGSLGCEDCGGREGGLSGGIQLGGSVSQKVLLGGGTTGWTKSEGGVTLTVGTAVALIRFYPSATGGFFLLGGLGVGTIHAEFDGFGSDSETGGGALIGLGYDIRVGPNVSMTPFWNGFAARTSNADANVGQLGLSVTLH